MPHPTNTGLGGDIGSVKPAHIEDSHAAANILIVQGVPPNSLGANGQWAMRTDSTSAGSRIYQKIGGVWTATTL